jgi:hypothetical protein
MPLGILILAPILITGRFWTREMRSFKKRGVG